MITEYISCGMRQPAGSSAVLQFLLSVVFLAFSIVTSAQQVQPAITMRTSDIDSDWNVRIRWADDISENLWCANGNYEVTLWRNGALVPGYDGTNRILNPPPAGYGSGISYIDVAVGIGDTSKWRMKYAVSGGLLCNDRFKISPVDNVTTYTQRLKKPIKVVATDSTSESALLNQIRLTWGKGTDAPNGVHHYYIFKDGEFAAHIPGTTIPREWIDTDVNPGEEHAYSIITRVSSSTWGSHVSDTVPVTGSTFPLLNASDGESFNTVDVQWPEMPPSVQSLEIFRGDEKIHETTDVASGTFADADVDLIPGYKYAYKVIAVNADGVAVATLSDAGFIRPDGRISGYVKAPFGGSVAEAVVYAERLNNDMVPQGNEHQVIYSDTTDSNGRFQIRDIFYHQLADFRVHVVKDDHIFQPASYETVTLDLLGNLIELPQPSFVDISTFEVHGNIAQIFEGAEAGVEGVEILIDSVFKGKTNADGDFSVTVDQSGTYTINPRFLNHTFDPEERIIVVDDDVHDVSFKDLARDTLSGYFLGGCGIYIGQATLKIYDTLRPTAAIDTIIKTESGTGYYEIILPSRAYTIEVVDFAPVDVSIVTTDQVVSFFGKKKVDLTEYSAVKDYVYRKPPEIEIVGFPYPGCAPFDVPIMEQVTKYSLEIKVFESLGTESCLTSSGYVVINDEISDGGGEPVTLQLVDGIAIYDLIAGSPNIVNGSEHPYQKKISFHADVEGQTQDLEQYVLVEGNMPKGETFITVTPEVPFLILRDPPGDESYSYLSENMTFNSSMMLYAKASGSVNVWQEIKLGVEQEAGVGVIIPYKIWGKVKASLEVGASLKGQAEYELEIKSENKFTTSGNQDVTGSDGDVFVGFAMNMRYALTDVIEYDAETCSVVTSEEIIMAPDGFSTTFIYTESHIEDVLIPRLEDIRRIYEVKGSDSSLLYDRQIDVWQQTLLANTTLKENAEFLENKSFSAGAASEFSTSVTSTETLSLEFDLFVEGTVAIEAGAEVGGTGASMGADVKFRMEVGGSTSLGSSHEKTVGYFLNDDDLGDFFSVDVKGDPVYGTPVFDLVSGRSSCPWEVGTQPRESAQLLIDKKVQYDIDRDAAATFKLNLGNTSQSDEDGTYNLVFLQESNSEGAVLTLGGSEVQGGILTPYFIPEGNSVDVTVTVRSGPQSNSYQDLRFALLSNCGDGIVGDTVSFSVYFKSNCSPIAISSPAYGWDVNGDDSNTLPVTISGYDKTRINHVSLQYKKMDSYEWKDALVVLSSDLLENNTVLDWNLTDVDDGDYEIRIKVDCGTESLEYSYSDIISGSIDRSPPALFGVPEPTSGSYSTGGEISATFDEPLNCFNVSADNVIIKDKNSGTIYPAAVGCSGNKVLIVPITDDAFQDQVVEISLAEIEDVHGNVTDEMIIWEFDIADANFRIGAETDSDGDGIVNSADNCPFAANPEQEDLNGDGVGDVCDEDADGDGVMSNVDNCPYAPNADQEDANKNGIGDVCDDDLDSDGDGVPDGADNCPALANPLQEDSNADGEGDACHVVTGLGDEANGERRLQLYPNPARDQINISFELERTSRVTVNILDLTSKIIQPVLDESLTYGKYTRSFNVQQLRNGLYIIQIDRNGRTESKKLFIQK